MSLSRASGSYSNAKTYTHSQYGFVPCGGVIPNKLYEGWRKIGLSLARGSYSIHKVIDPLFLEFVPRAGELFLLIVDSTINGRSLSPEWGVIPV